MEEAPQQSDASPQAARIALWLLCACACALFAVGAIRFFFGPTFAATFNSDAAVPVLLAKEVLLTGQPVPTTWYFGNAEIWTFAPHVFAMPFVAAFGVSTLALKLGNLLCVGVMVLFMTLTLHRVTRSWPYSILVAAGLFATFSGFQQMAVYAQTAYGWFTAQFAILIYLALRMRDESAPEAGRLFGRVGWTAILYALFVVNLAIDSPLRTIVYWVIPLLIVAAFSLSKAHSRRLAVLTVVAFLAGAVLHAVISMHLLTQAGLTAQFLNPVGKWKATLVAIARGLPIVIGYTQQPFATLLDMLGAARVCFFAAAAVVVLFAPAGDGPGSDECRFFARVSGAMLLVVVAVLLVGSLVQDPASDRYLIPPALLCLGAFMAIVWCRLRTRAYAMTAIAALFAAAFGGGSVVALSRPSGPVAPVCDASGNICRLEDLLAKTGIRSGYTTYWNGNVTTVVSHGAVTACGVLLSPRLAPFRWLVSRRCFDPPTDQRFFLALDRSEIAQVGRAFLVGEAGTPEQIVSDGQFEIWIYETATANLEWLKR